MQLQTVVDIIEELGPERGITLSTSATAPQPKSTIWVPSDILGQGDLLQRGLTRINTEGIVVLGSPVGSPGYEAAVLAEKVASVREMIARLSDLQDPQIEY